MKKLTSSAAAQWPCSTKLLASEICSSMFRAWRFDCFTLLYMSAFELYRLFMFIASCAGSSTAVKLRLPVVSLCASRGFSGSSLCGFCPMSTARASDRARLTITITLS